MKKLLFLILFAWLSQQQTFSQGCLPKGILFTTQAQVDSFPINYPGCAEIEGNVQIGLAWGSVTDIYNLTGLSSLNLISGSFLIYNNPMASLTGLESLEYIEGDLRIGQYAMWCQGNAYLVNMTGLNGLDSIGGDLFIDCNAGLTSLVGLEGLSLIGGNLTIGTAPTAIKSSDYWGGNASLVSLAGLNNLTSVGGNIFIGGNPALTSLSGLEGLTIVNGGLTVKRNFSLPNFMGLNNVNYINNGLGVYENSQLLDLSGLDHLDSINGGLGIGCCYEVGMGLPGGNASIISLHGLENVTHIGGGIGIGLNNSLFSLSGLDNIEPGTITSLQICNNDSLSNCDVRSICDYLASSTGEVYIQRNAPGCNSPEEVQAACLVGLEDTSLYNLNIYPNPSTGIFTVEFYLQHPGKATLVVHNSLGQVVIKPLDSILSEGSHQVCLNTDNQPAGVYYCRLQAGDHIVSNMIIKMQ